ncbi:MAG: hypothetical protein ABFD25_14320 [Clostridiaceae bacterium]
MKIGSMNSYYQMPGQSGNTTSSQVSKPSKPAEPTPPPGGNIENRKPPAEPTKPSGLKSSSAASAMFQSNTLDLYV